MLKRRQAFTASMTFLYKLTQGGNIREARQWAVTRAIGGLFPKKKTPMEELGLRVAREILKNESDEGKAAAILLLVGLDSAYNTVLAVSLP
jgi:hypothetical protein